MVSFDKGSNFTPCFEMKVKGLFLEVEVSSPPGPPELALLVLLAVDFFSSSLLTLLMEYLAVIFQILTYPSPPPVAIKLHTTTLSFSGLCKLIKVEAGSWWESLALFTEGEGEASLVALSICDLKSFLYTGTVLTLV